jgi:hypothetical protein
MIASTSGIGKLVFMYGENGTKRRLRSSINDMTNDIGFFTPIAALP